mmetsp:Transcript_31270/g.73870  ORF Transcript_31270/g.73870 Transcript_31270/m.73870 type:complete len:210 (+) Transcript_31270:458-1087(+)
MQTTNARLTAARGARTLRPALRSRSYWWPTCTSCSSTATRWRACGCARCIRCSRPSTGTRLPSPRRHPRSSAATSTDRRAPWWPSASQGMAGGTPTPSRAGATSSAKRAADGCRTSTTSGRPRASTTSWCRARRCRAAPRLTTPTSSSRRLPRRCSTTATRTPSRRGSASPAWPATRCGMYRVSSRTTTASIARASSEPCVSWVSARHH